MTRRFLTPILLAAFAAGPLPASAQDAILKLVPAKAEVVISIDVPKLAQTAGITDLLEKKECEAARRRIEALGTLTGIDPLKDLTRVALFGAVDSEEKMVFAFQGKYDKERLIALLKANKSYETSTALGVEVHKWHDQNEDKNKYGAFFPDQVALVTTSEESMNHVLRTHAGQEPNFLSADNSKAKYLPKEGAEAIAWGLLPRPGRRTRTEQLFEGLDMKALTAVLTSGDQSLKVTVNAVMGSPDDAVRVKEVLEGVIAAAQLQKELPIAGRVAGAATVPAPDGERASIVIEVPQDLVQQALARGICRK